MSACAAQTFDNFTQAGFNCLVQKAAGFGVTISTNQGQTTKDSVTISWNFDPVANTLQIQCLSHPFFLSCGTINQTIHDTVDSCASS
jgi:hypothetical protein